MKDEICFAGNWISSPNRETSYLNHAQVNDKVDLRW